MKTNDPTGGEEAVTMGQSDSARESPALTPKQTLLVESFVANPAAPTKVHGQNARYAESTVRNPKANGLVPRDLLPRYIAAQGEGAETLADLQPLAVQTLKEVMQDKEQPGSVRSSAAGGTLKLINETDPPQRTGDGGAWQYRLYKALRRGFLQGIKSCAVHGPDGAMESYQAVSERHAVDYPRPLVMVTKLEPSYTPSKAAMREKRED
jgi:hypothetical protein